MVLKKSINRFFQNHVTYYFKPMLGRLTHEDFARCAVGFAYDIQTLLRRGELSAVECVSGSDAAVVL